MILCSQIKRDDKLRGSSFTRGKRIVRGELIFFSLFKSGKKSSPCNSDALQMHRRPCMRGGSVRANACLHSQIGQSKFSVGIHI
jgi:hypothetical protein